MKVIQLFQTFCKRTKGIFKISRIKKYGFDYVFLEFLILLCHRSNSKFEHLITQKKDKKINNYLMIKYKGIINEYYSKN